MSGNVRTCQAKDPRTCRYHGTEIRMNEAQAKGDFNAYFKERTVLEALTPESKVDTLDVPTDTRVDLGGLKDLLKAIGIVPSRKLAKRNLKFENEAVIAGDAFNREQLKKYGLKKDDRLVVTGRKRYGYKSFSREVWKKTDQGWREIAWGTYDKDQIQRLMERTGADLNDKSQAANARLQLILEDHVERRKRDKLDS